MHLLTSLLSFSLLSMLLGAVEAKSQTEPPPTSPDTTQINPPAQTVEAAVGVELTLQESIGRAMGKSYNVIRAENTRDATREAKRAGYSNLGPSATVSYNEFHFDDVQSVNFGGQNLILRDDVSKTGSLVVTQPITGLYGYVEFARRSSLNEDIAEESLRGERANAGFAGAEAFLSAYNAQEQVRIAEQRVAAAQSSANDAAVNNRVGRTNKADYLKLQVNLSQAQTQLAQAKATRVAAIALLRATLRMDPAEVFHLKQDLPAPAIAQVAIDAAIAEALEKRPDVRRAAMTAESVGFEKKAAYTEFIPKVDLFGQLDRNFGKITGLGNPERDVKYYGIKASWTFWNNGASVFHTREAFARTRAEEANAALAKDNARVEVIAAVENLQASREALKLAELSVSQADEAYRIDGIRFKNGSISATDQILSESTKSGVQGQFVNARTQVLSNYFRLQKALGHDQPVL